MGRTGERKGRGGARAKELMRQNSDGYAEASEQRDAKGTTTDRADRRNHTAAEMNPAESCTTPADVNRTG